MNNSYVNVIVDNVIRSVANDQTQTLTAAQIQVIVAESLERCLYSDEFFAYMENRIQSRESKAIFK